MTHPHEGKSVKLHLIEGEEIVALVPHENTLYVKTNLGRIFKSTDAPVENIDFVEETL